MAGCLLITESQKQLKSQNCRDRKDPGDNLDQQCCFIDENKGSEKVTDLTQGEYLISNRARTGTWFSWFQWGNKNNSKQHDLCLTLYASLLVHNMHNSCDLNSLDNYKGLGIKCTEGQRNLATSFRGKWIRESASNLPKWWRASSCPHKTPCLMQLCIFVLERAEGANHLTPTTLPGLC